MNVVEPPKKKAAPKTNFRSFMKTQKNDLDSMVIKKETEPLLVENNYELNMTLKPSMTNPLGAEDSVMTPVESQKEGVDPEVIAANVEQKESSQQ